MRNMNRAGGLGIVALIFRLVGVLFLVIVVVLTVSEARRRQRCTRPVPAIVTGLQEHYSRNSEGYMSVTFRPIVTYEVDGRAYTYAQ